MAKITPCDFFFQDLIPLLEKKDIFLYKCCPNDEKLINDNCVVSNSVPSDIPVTFLELYGTDLKSPKEIRINRPKSYNITPIYDDKWRKENDNRYE